MRETKMRIGCPIHMPLFSLNWIRGNRRFRRYRLHLCSFEFSYLRLQFTGYCGPGWAWAELQSGLNPKTSASEPKAGLKSLLCQ